MLPLNDQAFELADTIVNRHALPKESHADALHISVAILYEMDYLLSWNCRHIANAERQKKIAQIIYQTGYNMPMLCTPEVLMGE